MSERFDGYRAWWVRAVFWGVCLQAVACGVSGESREGPSALGVVVDQGFVEAPWLGRAHLELLRGLDTSAGLSEARAATGWRVEGLPFQNIGFTEEALWGRLRLHNPSNSVLTVFLEQEYAFLDEYDVYHRSSTGEPLRDYFLGDHHPFSQRVIESTGFVVPLTLAPQSESEVYLRMTASEALIVKMHLWSAEARYKKERRWYQGYCVLYGMLLVMVLYNILLYASTRERSYGFYTLYLVSHIVFLLGFRGFGFQYLWPNSPVWNALNSSVLMVTMLGFLCMFVRSYLETVERSPRFDWGLRLCLVGLVTSLPVFFMVSPQGGLVATTVIALLVSGFLLVGGARMALRGDRAAVFFIAAFGVVLLNYLVSALGLMVGSATTFFVEMGDLFVTFGLEGAGVIEATLLSVGVGDRINRLNRETGELQRYNLDLQRRTTTELELEVGRQTRALRAALENLETAQAELLQQARSATIGNLVAGMAHEIGNPLNLTIGGAQELEDLLEELGREPERLEALLGPAARCATLVVRGSERIEGIIRNLNRLAITGEKPEEHVCDLNDTIHSTIGILQHRFLAESVSFGYEPVMGLKARINAGELSQVLLNLMLNSAHAMPDGGQITVSCGAGDGVLWVEVADTGEGVNEEIRGQIFDAFFTTREQGQGSGLGLSLSAQMLADSGGSLSLLDSEHGARFRIVLRPFGDLGSTSPLGAA